MSKRIEWAQVRVIATKEFRDRLRNLSMSRLPVW